MKEPCTTSTWPESSLVQSTLDVKLFCHTAHLNHKLLTRELEAIFLRAQNGPTTSN